MTSSHPRRCKFVLLELRQEWSKGPINTGKQQLQPEVKFQHPLENPEQRQVLRKEWAWEMKFNDTLLWPKKGNSTWARSPARRALESYSHGFHLVKHHEIHAEKPCECIHCGNPVLVIIHSTLYSRKFILKRILMDMIWIWATWRNLKLEFALH